MASPSDTEIMDAVRELVEVARKQALSEASGYDGNKALPASEESRSKIEDMLSDIEPRFNTTLTPNPDDFDVLINSMSEVEADLGSFKPTKNPDDELVTIGGDGDVDLLDTVKTTMQDWDGDLKNNFVEQYLTPLYPDIVTTHGSLAGFLRLQAEVMQKIYQRRRQDTKEIADKTITALEATDDKGPELAIFLMSILATLTGGLSSLVAGAASVAASMAGTAASLGATVAGEYTDDKHKEIPLAADTVEGVIKNMHHALDESEKTMSDEEDTVNDAIKVLEGLVYPLAHDESGGNELVPRMPEIVSASDETIAEQLTVYALRDHVTNMFTVARLAT